MLSVLSINGKIDGNNALKVLSLAQEYTLPHLFKQDSIVTNKPSKEQLQEWKALLEQAKQANKTA